MQLLMICCFVMNIISGYVVPAAPQYAMQAIPAPIPFQLPFLTRDLLRSSGRINFNANYSYAPNGDDLPCNFNSCIFGVNKK